jgi:hypothetical protein
MNQLDWIIGYKFQSLIQREYDWVIQFEKDVSLVVTCLWRLVESGRIRLTSNDQGQQFGLSAPIDAVTEVNNRLEGATVESVNLVEGLLDLEFEFESGTSFQVIADSSGYEAWTLTHENVSFIAVGGGELTVWDKTASDPD